MKNIFQKIHENHVIKNSVENLILSSKLDWKFFVMSIFSGFMAAIGILLHETAILIAAMVLAPLLNPVLAASAGIVLFHKKLILYSLKSFLVGVISIIFFVAIFTQILIFFDYNIDIIDFYEKFVTKKSMFLIMFMAFITGSAAVYSWLRPSYNTNFVGIAIAVSLIPFISFFGILLGSKNFLLLKSLLVFFGLNFFSLILGAMISFVFLGIFRVKKVIDKDLDKA